MKQYLIGALAGGGLVLAGVAIGALLFGGNVGDGPVPARLTEAEPRPAEESGRDPAMAAAEAAYAEGDLAGAYEALLPLAEAGHPLAQQRIGYMYKEGLHVEADADAAIEWLERAVAQDNAQARTMLRELLRERSIGEPVSGPVIADLSRAAELGDDEAQAVLGSYYLAGRGVPADPERALALLRPAGEAGDVRAQSNLGYIYATGTGTARDETQARIWYGRAAEAGLVRAQTAYALMLEQGRGGGRDVGEAMRWYLNAAEAGHRPAMVRLGGLIVEERMQPPSALRAAELVRAAAEAGTDGALAWLEARHAEGMAEAGTQIAMMYLEGDGLEQDRDRALDLLQASAEAGEPVAQYHLAQLYMTGDGVEQDYIKAHKWANLAAAQGLEAAVERRGLIAQLMTGDEIAEAQAAAAAWQENHDGSSP